MAKRPDTPYIQRQRALSRALQQTRRQGQQCTRCHALLPVDDVNPVTGQRYWRCAPCRLAHAAFVKRAAEKKRTGQ